MQINTDRVKNYKITSAIKPSLLKYSCEYRALATLRYLFPKRFNTLEHAEKPDLQDLINGVGIEVVNAVSKKDMEANRLLSNMRDNKNMSPEEIERLKKGIEACGYDLNDEKNSISKTGTGDGEKQVFQESIRKKIKKLPNYKKIFDKNGLAVVLPEIPTREAIDSLHRWIVDLVEENGCFFDFVFVISHRSFDYYDVQKNSFATYSLTEEENKLLRAIGRMTAEGGLSLSDLEWQ